VLAVGEVLDREMNAAIATIRKRMKPVNIMYLLNKTDLRTTPIYPDLVSIDWRIYFVISGVQYSLPQAKKYILQTWNRNNITTTTFRQPNIMKKLQNISI